MGDTHNIEKRAHDIDWRDLNPIEYVDFVKAMLATVEAESTYHIRRTAWFAYTSLSLYTGLLTIAVGQLGANPWLVVGFILSALIVLQGTFWFMMRRARDSFELELHCTNELLERLAEAHPRTLRTGEPKCASVVD